MSTVDYSDSSFKAQIDREIAELGQEWRFSPENDVVIDTTEFDTALANLNRQLDMHLEKAARHGAKMILQQIMEDYDPPSLSGSDGNYEVWAPLVGDVFITRRLEEVLMDHDDDATDLPEFLRRIADQIEAKSSAKPPKAS